MPIAENEALASLKILVAIARADGSLHHDERRSLSAALESLELPSGTTIDQLLATPVDVDAELAGLKSEEAREQIFRSAYFMAYADGACTKEEAAILDRIAAATAVTAETRAALERTFVGRAQGGDAPTKTSKLEDAEERAVAVRGTLLRCSVLSAALGAFPIPGLAIATDLAVIALQLKMIRDVGASWGHALDRQAAKSFLYGVGLGTGARLAVNNLAKLVPGWGSVIGATTSFVSTYALGKVIDQVFASGETAISAEVLRARFVANEAEARAVYEDQADVIIQSQRSNEAALATLTRELEAGRITQDEFDERIAALA